MATIYWRPAGDPDAYGSDGVTDQYMDAVDLLMVEYLENHGYDVEIGPRTGFSEDERDCADLGHVELNNLFARAWDYAMYYHDSLQFLSCIEEAAREIGKVGVECGTPYYASQSQYGVGWEGLVESEWLDSDDISHLSPVESYRFVDCDGDCSEEFTTLEEMEAIKEPWIRSMRQNQP